MLSHLLNWFLRPTVSELKKYSGGWLDGLTVYRLIIVIGLIIAIPSMILTFAPFFGISEEMIQESEQGSWLYSNRFTIALSLLGLAVLGFALYIRCKQLKNQYQPKDKLPKIGELPPELQISILEDRKNIDFAERQNDVFTQPPPTRSATDIPDRDNW